MILFVLKFSSAITTFVLVGYCWSESRQRDDLTQNGFPLILSGLGCLGSGLLFSALNFGLTSTGFTRTPALVYFCSLLTFVGSIQLLVGCYRWLPGMTSMFEKGQLLKNLTLAKKQSVASSEARRTFVEGLCHELRTSINGITGALEILRYCKISEEQLEPVRNLSVATNSLVATIDGIVDYLSLSNGTFQLNPTSFFVRDKVDQLVDRLQNELAKKNVRVNRVIHSSVPQKVRGDAAHLSLIWSAMILEIVKHCPLRSQISLVIENVSTTDTEVVLVATASQKRTVVSTEIGSRLRSVCVDTVGDLTWIGEPGDIDLGVAGKLCRLMGGGLTVVSSVEDGMCFSAIVRCHSAVATQAARIAEEAEEDLAAINGCFAGVHVLVVEDDKVNQYVTERLLEQLGCVVDVAADGRHALTYYFNGEFDLVLLDCELPEINGFEVAKRIRKYERKTKSRTPIIALTALSGAAVEEKCRKAGMDNFLGKPTNVSELLAVVAEVTGRRIPAANVQNQCQQG